MSLPAKLTLLGAIVLLGGFVYSLVITDTNTRSVLISIVGLTVTTLITLHNTKKREIAAKHRAQKSEGYMGYIDIFTDLGRPMKNRKIKGKDFENRIIEFKKTLLAWGGKDTIDAWNKTAKIANSIDEKPEELNPEMLYALADMLMSIRKELGHDNVDIDHADILKVLMSIDSHDQIDALYNV